jgi:glycosyltransferase involved in cell wall biosynthesis
MREVAPFPPDILHLHNLHGAWFDVRALPRLSAQVPTMITLHDAWLLTGHCAYPLDCTHWKGGCGECPALDLYVPIRHDASASNAAIKRLSVQASRLALACPSQWLLSMVRGSGIETSSTIARVIPNGIDTRVFRAAEKTRVRADLGLPMDATILSFAARGLEGSPYKGFDTLRSALSMLAEETLSSDATILLALGSVTGSTRVGNIEIRSIPFIESPSDVARIYQASDLYVHPARAESFGLAVAEAMACGTPVAAAAVGGIPEIIEDGRSGVLFSGDDASALAAAVRDLLADEEKRTRIGAGGARRIRDRFTLEMQVDAYLDWYRELIEEWGA